MSGFYSGNPVWVRLSVAPLNQKVNPAKPSHSIFNRNDFEKVIADSDFK